MRLSKRIRVKLKPATDRRRVPYLQPFITTFTIFPGGHPAPELFVVGAFPQAGDTAFRIEYGFASGDAGKLLAIIKQDSNYFYVWSFAD
jgi:hypothetical protein